jgi:hypothetical protein
MEAPTKQPPNWMGFDQFSEEDNKDIAWARWYVDDLELGNKPSIDPERGKLYLLIDKIAQLLDEKEGNNASS